MYGSNRVCILFQSHMCIMRLNAMCSIRVELLSLHLSHDYICIHAWIRAYGLWEHTCDIVCHAVMISPTGKIMAALSVKCCFRDLSFCACVMTHQKNNNMEGKQRVHQNKRSSWGPTKIDVKCLHVDASGHLTSGETSLEETPNKNHPAKQTYTCYMLKWSPLQLQGRASVQLTV